MTIRVRNKRAENIHNILRPGTKFEVPALLLSLTLNIVLSAETFLIAPILGLASTLALAGGKHDKVELLITLDKLVLLLACDTLAVAATEVAHVSFANLGIFLADAPVFVENAAEFSGYPVLENVTELRGGLDILEGRVELVIANLTGGKGRAGLCEEGNDYRLVLGLISRRRTVKTKGTK